MKEKCDNNCLTCHLATQIYCSLMYVRATNDYVEKLCGEVREYAELAKELKQSLTTIAPIKEEGKNE